VRLEYLLPGQTEPETFTKTVALGGSSQVHVSKSGIQVPGLNVWLIIALVGGVWALLLSVGVRVFAIARASASATATAERALRPLRVGAREIVETAGTPGA